MTYQVYVGRGLPFDVQLTWSPGETDVVISPFSLGAGWNIISVTPSAESQSQQFSNIFYQFGKPYHACILFMFYC